uniref:VM domain-containing protein n=1 Tax=Glossina brevipalpis TaxID=37001 RepID=A0A1A9WHM5_9MUSC
MDFLTYCEDIVQFRSRPLVFVAGVRANVVAVGTGVGNSPTGIVAAPVIQAPPCPKNYMFTCQPHMAPVPCSQSAPVNYGSVGAYSESVPTIIAVPYAAASYPNVYQNYPPTHQGYTNNHDQGNNSN